MKKITMYHYKLNGLEYYVTAPNIDLAVYICILNKWGVTKENLSQINTLPKNPQKHISY